jgi:hypothetical protein
MTRDQNVAIHSRRIPVLYSGFFSEQASDPVQTVPKSLLAPTPQRDYILEELILNAYLESKSKTIRNNTLRSESPVRNRNDAVGLFGSLLPHCHSFTFQQVREIKRTTMMLARLLFASLLVAGAQAKDPNKNLDNVSSKLMIHVSMQRVWWE